MLTDHRRPLHAVTAASACRELTPMEDERLQLVSRDGRWLLSKPGRILYACSAWPTSPRQRPCSTRQAIRARSAARLAAQAALRLCRPLAVRP